MCIPLAIAHLTGDYAGIVAKLKDVAELPDEGFKYDMWSSTDAGTSRMFKEKLVPQYGLNTEKGVSSILHVIGDGSPHAVVLRATTDGAYEIIDGAAVYKLAHEEVMQAFEDATDRSLMATSTLRSARDSGHQSDLLSLSAKGKPDVQ